MKKTLMISAAFLAALTGYSTVIMDDDFSGYGTGHYPGTPYPAADSVSRANAIDGSSTIGDGNALEFWDTSTSAYALLERNLCADEAGEYGMLHISFDFYNTRPAGSVGEIMFSIGSYSSVTDGGATRTQTDYANRYMALRFDCTDGANGLIVENGTGIIDNTLTYNPDAVNHMDIYLNDGPDGPLPADTFTVYLDGTLLGEYSMADSPLSIGESNGLGRIAFQTGRSTVLNAQIDNLFVEAPVIPAPATMGFSAANGIMTVTAANLSNSFVVTNTLQTTTNLTFGTWSNLCTVTGETQTNWTLPSDSPQRFYRIKTFYSLSESFAFRVLLAGDSTVNNFDPIVGWGQRIGRHFKPGIKTINKAYPGRSSKTFIEEGRWADLLSETQPGDYILVQFAHNDSHDPSQPESTDAETDYRDYLRIYADDAASAGASLVFVTSPHRRWFNEDGSITQELLPYADAMKVVAQEKNVPVVDLYSLSGADMQELGEEGCLPLFTSADDRTHFSDEGANWLAGLVAGELKKITNLVAED